MRAKIKALSLRYLSLSSVPRLILLQAVFLKMSKKRKKKSNYSALHVNLTNLHPLSVDLYFYFLDRPAVGFLNVMERLCVCMCVCDGRS